MSKIKSHLVSKDVAIVVAAYGRNFLIETANQHRILCVVRGKKKDVVVGDQVLWTPSYDGGVIEQTLPRKNVFYRQDQLRTKIFAANLDLIILLMAAEPKFSQRQLTRTLIAVEQAQIPVLLVLNKSDLQSQFVQALQDLQLYINSGYQLIQSSIVQQPEQILAQLKPWLSQRRTLIVGASGVGKSSLINLLVPNASIRTNEISQALNSGKHTTTSSTLYWLDDLFPDFNPKTSAIIDSPGFQEFGLNHINAQQLLQYFPDLFLLMQQQRCKFDNCSHIHEPNCALQRSLTSLALQQRYQLFVEIYKELTTQAKQY